MCLYYLRLLGPAQVEREGAPVQGFESRKALALLCYLATHDHPVSRSHLADLFWPGKPEPRARGNLRRVLHNLHTRLPGCLQTDRHTVQFQRRDTTWLDIAAFDERVAQGDAGSLAAAVELYRGDFLDGLYLDGCPEFEGWLVTEREVWRQRVSGVLQQLSEDHTYRGEYRPAMHFASRLLALDPWREEAHRQMMLLLARSGQRSAALAQYETCRQMLADELGVAPSEETVALYERIRSAPAHRHNLPAQPTAFIGREEELAALAQRLADPACRLVTVVGPGGMGKTRLALQTAAHQVDAFLHGVYFVRLAPVSSVEHLVPAIAEAVGFTFSGAEEPRVQLLNHLREQELLLVLDNFEHLLLRPETLGDAQHRPVEGAGTGLVVDILREAPAVKLLVTRNPQSAIRNSPPYSCFSTAPNAWIGISLPQRKPRGWCGCASWWKGCRWGSSWRRRGWCRWGARKSPR
ncbi:MAG: BTAD domain-containing putative transcriptional regulator [Anaerolineae bacterium]